MKTAAPAAALIGILMAVSLPTTEAQTLVYNPIVSINFNQTGDTAPNAGSLGSNYNMSLYRSDRLDETTVQDPVKQSEMHSNAGTGVSGESYDRALDFTANTMNGTNGLYTSFENETNSDLAPLGNLTVTGWYKIADQANLAGVALFRNYFTEVTESTQRNGWGLQFASSGTMRFSLGNGTSFLNANSNTNAYTSNGGEWLFFAFTWDGSNATFYNGTTINGAANVGSPAISGTMAGDSSSAYMGRLNTGSGAFSGLIDNFQIYNTALDATEIESIRTAAIPEPSAIALLAASLGGLLLWRRRSLRASR